MATTPRDENNTLAWFAPPPGPFKLGGTNASTLNAVSFGFIATAVLFAMFLVMAIFERILRPHRNRANAGDVERSESIPGSADSVKDGSQLNYSSAVPVIMAGEDFPTCFAMPAPVPCKAETLVYPSHDASSSSWSEASDKETSRDLEFGQGRASTSSPSEKETFQEHVVVIERGECSSSSSSSASPGKEDIEDLEVQVVSSGSSPDRNLFPSPNHRHEGRPTEGCLPSPALSQRKDIQDSGSAQVEASKARLIIPESPSRFARPDVTKRFLPSPASPEKEGIQELRSASSSLRIFMNATPYRSPGCSPDGSPLPSLVSPEKEVFRDVGREQGEPSRCGPGGKEPIEDQ